LVVEDFGHLRGLFRCGDRVKTIARHRAGLRAWLTPSRCVGYVR
jgi:hypothetical protein